MNEILVSVVDTKTGEVYKHDQLSAVAHLWCVEFGWKIIAEDVYDSYHCDGELIPARRSLFVEPTPDGGRFPVRTEEWWEQTRNWMAPGTCKWKGTVV